MEQSDVAEGDLCVGTISQTEAFENVSTATNKKHFDQDSPWRLRCIKKKPCTRVRWDEETIQEHNKLRGTRTRIKEPGTPFCQLSDSGGDENDNNVLFVSPRELTRRLQNLDYVLTNGENRDASIFNRTFLSPEKQTFLETSKSHEKLDAHFTNESKLLSNDFCHGRAYQ